MNVVVARNQLPIAAVHRHSPRRRLTAAAVCQSSRRVRAAQSDVRLDAAPKFTIVGGVRFGGRAAVRERHDRRRARAHSIVSYDQKSSARQKNVVAVRRSDRINATAAIYDNDDRHASSTRVARESARLVDCTSESSMFEDDDMP